MDTLRRIDANTCALLLILTVYAALGARFAVKTPPWQNPDEPAHYNYVAHVATERQLPVLRMGDYDETYLRRLKAEKFPPHLSIEPVRYEFHQPPLYYLLAAPVYLLSGGELVALRLFSVALGGGVVLLIYLCARIVVPDRPLIALGAAAFTAFLPMHAALMAAVNNDALAELLIAAAILALLHWQRNEARGQWAAVNRLSGQRSLLAIGAIIGLGFLTKATTYILLPTALIVLFVSPVGGSAKMRPGLKEARSVKPPLAPRAPWMKRQNAPRLKRSAQYGSLIAPALLLGLPWWIRNGRVYGNLDFLGLAWHEAVVTGQTTTAAWIAENGWIAYWERAWTFTAKSFWGVFGWLGVFMDARIYTACFILSVMAAVGVLSWGRRWTNAESRRWSDFLSSPWLALLLLWLGTFSAYVWYNFGFIQHQGRYLFSALPVWSLLFAVGWWAVLEKRASIASGALLLAAAGGQALVGMTVGAFDKWTLLLYGLAGAGLVLHGLISTPLSRLAAGSGGTARASVQPFEDGILRPILYVCLFLALIALDFAIPILYIAPQLSL